jgi:branched-subunit amino acid aminotransferase/4-amino-4-deoxychorismate lyase
MLPQQRPGGAGLRVVVAQSRHNERSASAGHKTLGSADAIYELSRAQGQGADDCLFLDTMGHVAEGSAGNVFVYDGEALLTPPLSCGVLPGVTRGVVLEVAGRLGVPVAERAFGYDELLLARELFLTSSLREIAPVREVDGRRLAGGSGVTGALSTGFRKVVAAEITADGPCTSEQ